MRLVCRALPSGPIILRPTGIGPETPFAVGDETTAHFDDGTQITLHRSPEHYRVSVRDGSGQREWRDFATEPDARAHAKGLVGEYYPGGAIRTVLHRHGLTVTYVRTPEERQCPTKSG